jgi:hypothetical protein
MSQNADGLPSSCDSVVPIALAIRFLKSLIRSNPDNMGSEHYVYA